VRRKKITIVSFALVLVVVSSSISTIQPVHSNAIDSLFTLVYICGGGIFLDYGNIMKQNLAHIGINVDVIVKDWGSLIGELLEYHNFDITYMALTGGRDDPDFTNVYSENGSLNIFGYDTSMDFDGWVGKNEWYIRQGMLIMPPDSEERIQHYWAWEDYLMDSICPLLPLFTQSNYIAYWANLNNFLFNHTLKQCWGQMSWSGSHSGQNSTDEIVITDAAWTELNPLFQEDPSSSYISSQCLDPLIYYDADFSVWPHLAESYTMLNDTTLEIVAREGIPWGADPDGSFLTEEFDIEDVYFTLFAWKYLSNDQQVYDWIEDMVMDQAQNKLTIYIDGDPGTPEKEPYAPFLPSVSLNILPEHYLNQTQLGDGITPDINHLSWTNYSLNCFGTSLFNISSFTTGVETILTVNPDCWWLDPAVNKINMDFVDRFGDFTGGLTKQRIRIIPDSQTALSEFEAGKVDIESVTAYEDKRREYETDTTKTVQSDLANHMGFFGFNMRENRPHIGDRRPCIGDPTISVGLAIRKAICYAVDRDEINNVIHGGSYTIIHWPIYAKLGIWCNPNIIRYDYDIATAMYYMQLAGYTETSHILGYTFTMIIGLLIGTFTTIIIFDKKRKY